MAFSEVPEAEVDTSGRLFVLVSFPSLDFLNFGSLLI
jgi:hypothetical protein